VLAYPALVAVVTAPLGGPALPGLRSAGVDEIQARWGGGLGKRLMCWFNRHWWRPHPEEWAVRVCRICRAREQAMYHSATGLYWIRL